MRSLKIAEATVFFGRQQQGQEPPPSPLQEASLHPVAELSPAFPGEAHGRTEASSPLPVPLPRFPDDPRTAEVLQEPLTLEMDGARYLGQRLGNYQIIRLLGEGGFAQVYLGEHIHYLSVW